MVLGPISLDIGTDHQKMTELEYQEAAALQGVENACQTPFHRDVPSLPQKDSDVKFVDST